MSFYTVRIFDKNNPDNIYGKDTDSPSQDFNLILKKIGIHLSSVDNIMYLDFLNTLNLAISKLGNEIVFSLFIDKQKDVSINFNLVCNGQNFSCQSSKIDDIINYIHGMCEK